MNTLRVLLFAACFKQLGRRYPSLFDGARAAEQVRLALQEETA